MGMSSVLTCDRGVGMASWFFFSFLVLVLDQLSKYFVGHEMQLGQSISVIPGILALTYVHNTGAAFGLLSRQTALLAGITASAVVGVILYRKRLAQTPLLVRFGVFLALGGAVGNLVDRLFFGAVRDFVYIRYFAVFNVADCAIVVGVGLIALALLLDGRHDAGRS